MLAELAIILGTFHSQPGFNDFNLGALASYEVGLPCQPTAGAYFNSESHLSLVAGCKKSWGSDLRFSLTGGVLTGYAAGKVLPFVIPTVSYGPWNASLLPPPAWVGKGSDVAALNISYSIRF